MKLEINIRIDRPGSSLAADNQEATRVLATLHNYFGDINAQRIGRQIEGPNDLELHDVMWAEIDAWPLKPAMNRLHTIAAVLGRDCIAVYLPSSDTGSLVGPVTQGYGRFDIDRFVQPLVAY